MQRWCAEWVTISVTNMTSRIDRLADLERLLRETGTATTESLAGELGVSRRTVLRDVATLRARGVPIEADAGPGGGLRLDCDKARVAVSFGVTEIAALWLSATLSRSATALPWGHAARTALSKLAATLPKIEAMRLRALCRRVVVGPPASESAARHVATTSSEILQAVEASFHAGLGLAFDYEDRHGRRSHRRIEPHGLLVQAPLWYILARDVEHDAPRMFRLDRITRPRVLAGATFVPDIQSVLDPTLPRDAFGPLGA